MRSPLVVITTALALAAVTLAAAPATVRVRVRDTATGEPIAARAYLWRGAESLLPDGFPAYDRAGAGGDVERHFLVEGDFTLSLEPGTYRLRLERGHEYVPLELTITRPGPDTVEARLGRWIDMNAAGWYSADMHVHRDPADLPLVLQAEDLNFVPTITAHVWSEEVNQPWKPRPEFPTLVAPTRFFTSNGQEIERIQGGSGALIVLGREGPIAFTGYELFPPSASIARTAKQRGAFVEGDKPFWVDTFVNALLGDIDALEVNCNHFMPRGVETDLTPWSHWPVEFGYRGARGFAEWVMASYYRLLNAGVELPLSAGTANGVKPGPVGFNRVYVHRADRTIDYTAFMEALRVGRSFSTNGPMLEFEIDGTPAAGARLLLDPSRGHRVRARARWRSELERLQLVVNGSVVAEQARGNTGELVLDHVLKPTGNAWVSVRAFARVPPHPSWVRAPVIFAHSSPAYIRRQGELVLVRQSLEQLLVQANTLVAHTTGQAGFRSEDQRQETLTIYRSARDLIASRLARSSAR